MTCTISRKKTFRKDYFANGKPEALIVTVRFDDSCNNGHDTFAITADRYEAHRQYGEPKIKHKSGRTLWLNGGGCLHEEIAEHFPELAKYIKWHLCSTDGPLHYVSNTVYQAGDRDCWGLRKGEFKQFTTKEGLPLWELAVSYEQAHETVASAEAPPAVTLQYKPYGREGEGKESDLEAARHSAVWPDATDEDLTAPGLEERLKARLPKLLEEFHQDMQELFGGQDE